MWPWAAQYNLVGRGLETHGVKDLPSQGRDGILKIVYFSKNYIENDVVISEVDARAHAVLSKEKKHVPYGHELVPLIV
jgi:hypothetical protein